MPMGDACEFGSDGEMKTSIARRRLELRILATKRFVPNNSFNFTTTDHALKACKCRKNYGLSPWFGLEK